MLLKRVTSLKNVWRAFDVHLKIRRGSDKVIIIRRHQYADIILPKPRSGVYLNVASVKNRTNPEAAGAYASAPAAGEAGGADVPVIFMLLSQRIASKPEAAS